MGKYSKMSTFAGAILGLLGLKEVHNSFRGSVEKWF